MKKQVVQATTNSQKKTAARQGLGRTGERLAAEELFRQGYRILEQNFRLHACSDRSWRIDVVAVQLSKNGKPEEIRIYQHAVSE